MRSLVYFAAPRFGAVIPWGAFESNRGDYRTFNSVRDCKINCQRIKKYDLSYSLFYSPSDSVVSRLSIKFRFLEIDKADPSH